MVDAFPDSGDLVSATASNLKALAANPDSVEILSKLAHVMAARGLTEPAIRICRRILTLEPRNVNAAMHLGALLWQTGSLEAAAEAFGRVTRLRPQSAEAWGKLAIVLGDLGRQEEAIAHLQRAVALDPTSASLHSDLLHAMHYSEKIDRAALFDEHLRWAGRHGRALPGERLGEPPPRKAGRIRIGYMSADFREHPTARLMFPLLEHHDRRQLQIFCYSDVKNPDAMTESLRAACETWRDVSALDVAGVQKMAREDGIDILVDLAGHYSNRLLRVFAQRVAAVQVTMYGYLNTTGLKTTDWRITDKWFDPPGMSEAFHTERVARLEGSAWCYRPLISQPGSTPLPMLAKGHVTFGCLNRFAKITPHTMRLWAKILDPLPSSRLMLHSSHPTSAEPSVIERVAEHGIDPARVDWVARKQAIDYLKQYASIDIALDTFPQNGGVTTLDSLWMGVPVVSRYGEECRSRLGLGILSNIGLGEMAVATDEQYVHQAIALARDLDRLATLRSALPAMMRDSPLMDEAGFTRELESALVRMMERK